jgi:hypothetical protein
MVVAEGLTNILYTQNDHGDLASQFAAHWEMRFFGPCSLGFHGVCGEAHDPQLVVLGRESR